MTWSFPRAAERLEAGSVDGLLADVGVSSMQLDEAHRGFSFQADGALDMRMNPRQGVTAEQVVNQFGEKELADLIYEFGEERRSRRIARAIVRARPITTTAELARVVAGMRPANETGTIARQACDSSGDANLSGAPDLCEWRAGRAEGAARGRSEVVEAGWKAGGDQLSFFGRPAGKGCISRRGSGRDLRSLNPEAADRRAG